MLRLRILAVTWVAGVGLCGCSPAGPGSSVGYQRYVYTCCAGDGPQATWHPGDTVTVRWIVQPAEVTADSTGQRITLTAVLTGPYKSVAELKSGAPASLTLRATPIVTTDRTNGSPVSSIALPPNIPTGFYNVADDVGYANGHAGGAAIVQVSAGRG
jgi:hypothetical protein